MQVEALTAVFSGALTNVQQRSGSGLWLRFHIATIKQKMAIKDHRKRNKIQTANQKLGRTKCLPKVFFFIFISTPEGHERGTFWRIIISFQSGTENID